MMLYLEAHKIGDHDNSSITRLIMDTIGSTAQG